MNAMRVHAKYTRKTAEDMTDLIKDSIDKEGRQIAETLEDIVDRKEECSGTDSDAASAEKPAPEKTSYDKIALMALVVAVIAWGILLVPAVNSGYVALAVAVLSVILSLLGLKSRRRGWRDTATTALIIGGVLTVVIVSFIVVIYVGLKGV